MPNIKTAISIDETLFEEVDNLARKMDISRSRFFVIAVKDFIQSYRNKSIFEQINKAYKDKETDDERSYLHRMKTKHRKVIDDKW